MFRVAERDYEITGAWLEMFARTDEGVVCWGVKVTAKHRGRPDDSDPMSSWRPAILSDVLVETKAGQVAHWYEIAGTTVEWDEPNADPQALFEVFGTAALYRCKCQFIGVPGNTGVRFSLEGMVDVDADYRQQPIRVDTILKVAPWPCADMPEQQCRDELHRLGFRDRVDFEVIDGVSFLVFSNQ